MLCLHQQQSWDCARLFGVQCNGIKNFIFTHLSGIFMFQKQMESTFSGTKVNVLFCNLLANFLKFLIPKWRFMLNAFRHQLAVSQERIPEPPGAHVWIICDIGKVISLWLGFRSDASFYLILNLNCLLVP
jgi:hypothetical protein